MGKFSIVFHHATEEGIAIMKPGRDLEDCLGGAIGS